MMSTFKNRTGGLSSPGAKHYAIVPSDSTVLDPKPRALFVGAVGDIAIEDELGVVVLYVGAVGILPFRPAKVMATGTTADFIVAIL